MREVSPGKYQLARRYPWLVRTAAVGFPLRILECERCGFAEKHSVNDGVADSAAKERRFIAIHKACQ